MQGSLNRECKGTEFPRANPDEKVGDAHACIWITAYVHCDRGDSCVITPSLSLRDGSCKLGNEVTFGETRLISVKNRPADSYQEP